MVQTVATMISLLMAIGAVAVIAASIADDWAALHRALAPIGVGFASSLPPRTRRLVPAPRARIVRVSAPPSALRAAA